MLRLLEGERSLPPELRNLPRAFRDRYMVGASYREAVAERAEYLALPESKAQARAAAFPPDLPLTVVTATFIVAPGHDIPVEELVPGHLALQAKLARMSSRGKQIVAPNSGHIVQLDRPELVVRAIQDMIRP
jgi:pimeloyl-ACP methyl ester carboxylesterase